MEDRRAVTSQMLNEPDGWLADGGSVMACFDPLAVGSKINGGLI